METLKEKEWLFINDVIKRIYEKENMQELGDTFLRLIRKMVPFKNALFAVINSDFTVIPNLSKFIDDVDSDAVEIYNEKYASVDYTNAVVSFPISTSFRGEDIIDEEKKVKNLFYTGWLEPKGYHYIGGLIIKVPNGCNVFAMLYRDELNGPLKDRELFILELFIGHLENIIASIMEPKERIAADIDGDEAYHILSEREKEVLPYILRGYSNEELADKFFVSVSTAKKHVYNILRKYNVNSRRELIKHVVDRQ